jgi:GNAT superfamily N-acetyltransferase
MLLASGAFCILSLTKYHGEVALDYSRLTAGRILEALELMRRFYTEESLEFRVARAQSALEQLTADPSRGCLWFIESAGRAVGYFVITSCYSLEFGGRFALLDEFYVTPEARGAGVGAQALTRIQEEAARMGVAALRLEVDRHNPRVRAFYARSGFAAHDRDLMTKWLRA